MSKRVPFTGDEKRSLHVSLDRHRDVVLWKLEGLDDEALRRPMTPSGTSLLGLVKHLASVEYGWFCQTFGRETEPLPDVEADPEADLRVERDETTAQIVISTAAPARPPIGSSRSLRSKTLVRRGLAPQCPCGGCLSI